MIAIYIILDLECDEAFERSKREQDRNYINVNDSKYKESSMFSDTMQSRNAIAKLKERIKNPEDQTLNNNEIPQIECHIYDDISLFLVITEKIAFM